MIRTQVLRESPDFQGFMERVKAKRDEALTGLRFNSGEGMARAQGAYNALDEVANLLNQIEGEQQAMPEDDD